MVSRKIEGRSRCAQSMTPFFITAEAEKLSFLDTVDYLRARAERADLEAVL